MVNEKEKYRIELIDGKWRIVQPDGKCWKPEYETKEKAFTALVMLKRMHRQQRSWK